MKSPIASRFTTSLMSIFQFLLLHRFVYMPCFHIFVILDCGLHSQFSKSQLSFPSEYLLNFQKLSGSNSYNRDCKCFQIVLRDSNRGHTYPQSFPASRNPSSSEFFWCSSSHQLLLAIETRNIKKNCFQNPLVQFNKTFNVFLTRLVLIQRHRDTDARDLGQTT